MFVAPASMPAQRAVQRYEPRGGARELILSRDPEVLIVGPAGTGKTLAACYRIHFDLLRYPGSRALMARKVLEDLKSGALSTFINTVQPGRAGVKEFGGNRFYPAEFRYPNGSVMLVVGLDKPGKVMSAEFDRIYVNEAIELNEEDWKLLKTRLRNGKMPTQQLIADCNPASPRHWLNRRCNDGLTRRIISTHKDNPAYWDASINDWTPLGRQYVEENLGSLTGVERERLFKGMWAAAEGLVYADFNALPIDQGGMVGSPDTEHWRRFMGVDVGGRNPTSIGRAHVASDDRMHISKLIYQRGMTASDIVAAICEEADDFQPEQIFIDPSAKLLIDDLIRLGYPVYSAENDVLEGIRECRAVLRRGFTIDPSCVEMIDEYNLYTYPSRQKIETDKPAKENDHAMDMWRYIVMGVRVPVMEVGLY